MRRTVMLGVLLALGVNAQASERERLFELSTQTGMPHLETSLRYAVRKETRCLSARQLVSAFWMLDDVSLQDCRLIMKDEEAGRSTHELACTGGHGTTGKAVWETVGPGSTQGTLNVRLGGKNMTFHQRVAARELGDCPGR